MAEFLERLNRDYPDKQQKAASRLTIGRVNDKGKRRKGVSRVEPNVYFSDEGVKAINKLRRYRFNKEKRGVQNLNQEEKTRLKNIRNEVVVRDVINKYTGDQYKIKSTLDFVNKRNIPELKEAFFRVLERIYTTDKYAGTLAQIRTGFQPADIISKYYSSNNIPNLMEEFKRVKAKEIIRQYERRGAVGSAR